MGRKKAEKSRRARIAALAKDIKSKAASGGVSEATLDTHERVLARITDGIYRQPASALRELIANAYDADATSVRIQTDAPRFSKIDVIDDGNGLTPAALANLVYSIGGSPKRTADGVALEVVNTEAHDLSPGGRKLIGKIGIGLFAVSQMTRHFQIITKRAKDKYRYVADVVLHTHSEEEVQSAARGKEPTFRTGTVKIWGQHASDTAAHGTTIALMDLRNQTRELLRSRERWIRTETPPEEDEDESDVEFPEFHIGHLAPGENDIIDTPACLPWEQDDAPAAKFGKLYQAVIDDIAARRNPKLEIQLDNYLRMIWTLALSSPIDYVGKHPFDLTRKDKVRCFRLSNEAKGLAEEVCLPANTTLRKELGLVSPERGGARKFEAYVDGIQLLRPIRFTELPATDHALKKPLMFVGGHTPDLSSFPSEFRGGDLSFEAYLFWMPKVVPKENNGILVRIADANGTLFDETFMKYQISEQTRIRQVTAEVFVRSGMDAALNIDRESFNYAHPHYRYLQQWAHSAFRQFATMQKRLAKEVRVRARSKEQQTSMARLEVIAAEELEQVKRGGSEDPTEVELLKHGDPTIQTLRKNGVLAFDVDTIFSWHGRPTGAVQKREFEKLKSKLEYVAQVLDAYGVFEDMPYGQQEQLLRAVTRILFSEE